eukprot:GFKZ01013500.1.p1 GENE.GFKZ01013500.1~~GFKZ01013500.1.p1  ORF type:complete len:283 (+),score=34.44 GFKZ01013500.1:36-851(+)
MTTPPQTPTATPTALVSTLLTAISSTDRGLSISDSQRAHVDSLIHQLNTYGKYHTPMSDPRLFSKYTVAYTSTNDKSPPAGGLFRSPIGRLIFQTRGLFQHVLAPDVIINMVCFRLLGIIKGCVTLRGNLRPIQDANLGPNAIQVQFEPPRIAFGSAVFQYGPRSRVRLTTTYLDDRVRLAVGSRGSLFVFVNDAGDSGPMADEWKAIVKATPLPVWLLPVCIVSVVVLAFSALRLLGYAAIVVAMMMAYVLKRGAFADDAPSVIDDAKGS